jgi:hypothetical protein
MDCLYAISPEHRQPRVRKTLPQLIYRPNEIETGLKRPRIRPLRRAAVTRDALKALTVSNDFMETQVQELKADVSSGYARGYYHGRFKT